MGGVGVASAKGEQPTWGRPKQTRPPVRTVEEDEREAEEEFGKARVSAGAEWGPNDPEQKRPTWESTGGQWYAAKTDAGVRYVWSLPVGAERGKSYDVVIALHPSGESARWIMTSHAAGGGAAGGARFLPGNVVVGVDGLTATATNAERRRFAVGPETIGAMRDVVLQMTRTLPGRRFYLYASGDAADFGMAFAARFPALADGLVLHRINRAAEAGFRGSAPIVLLHGAKDSMTPVGRALMARSAFEEKGHTGVRVRVLPSFNDYPNPVRAAECFEWVAAVQAESAAEVVERVRSMLRPKAADEYGYQAPVWFAGAWEALGRVTGRETAGKWKAPAGAVGDKVMAEARALEAAIDAHAAKHVEELRKIVTGAGSLTALDGSPAAAWMWHAREDFRGVPAMEAFVVEMGYDALLAEQMRSAAALTERWGQTRDPMGRAEALPEFLAASCAAPTLPVGIVSTLRAAARANDGVLPEELQEMMEAANNVERTWNEGPRAYRNVWRQWRLPE